MYEEFYVITINLSFNQFCSRQEIKKEIDSLKKQYKDDKKIKTNEIEKDRAEEEAHEKKSDLLKAYILEKEKYNKLKEMPKKGSSRYVSLRNIMR